MSEVEIRYLETKYKPTTGPQGRREYEKVSTTETLRIVVGVLNDVSRDGSVKRKLQISLFIVDGATVKSPYNLFIPSVPSYPASDESKLRGRGKFNCSDSQLLWFNWIYEFTITNGISCGIDADRGLNIRTAMIIAVVGSNFMTNKNPLNFGSDLDLRHFGTRATIVLCNKYINIPTGIPNEYYACETPKLTDLRAWTELTDSGFARSGKVWDPFSLQFIKDKYEFH